MYEMFVKRHTVSSQVSLSPIFMSHFYAYSIDVGPILIINMLLLWLFASSHFGVQSLYIPFNLC